MSSSISTGIFLVVFSAVVGLYARKKLSQSNNRSAAGNRPQCARPETWRKNTVGRSIASTYVSFAQDVDDGHTFDAGRLHRNIDQVSGTTTIAGPVSISTQM